MSQDKNTFLEETRKSGISLFRVLRPFYGRLDYGGLRGWVSYDFSTLRTDEQSFEDKLTKWVDRLLNSSEIILREFSYVVIFEWGSFK